MSRERFDRIRERIVHDYEGVRMEIVWETIWIDFPRLLNQLSNL